MPVLRNWYGLETRTSQICELCSEKTYGLMGSGSLLYPKNEAALHNASIFFQMEVYVRLGFHVSWHREMKLFHRCSGIGFIAFILYCQLHKVQKYSCLTFIQNKQPKQNWKIPRSGCHGKFML
ncbi:hypothetical protein J1N35_019723 [Gossypium stocksii]|uniref:Uncharacterized protein n=1 Tax=Gossypium stocksii TaxID=47602 RepID=A0A9D3VCN7_9ROSI|nr:hypothetical protein J1N35_019723 [Gossypium stocksii]